MAEALLNEDDPAEVEGSDEQRSRRVLHLRRNSYCRVNPSGYIGGAEVRLTLVLNRGAIFSMIDPE